MVRGSQLGERPYLLSSQKSIPRGVRGLEDVSASRWPVTGDSRFVALGERTDGRTPVSIDMCGGFLNRYQAAGPPNAASAILSYCGSFSAKYASQRALSQTSMWS